MTAIIILVYLLSILAFLLVIIHFITKIIDWYNKRNNEKYCNCSAEFVSDLYQLKMKWAKRGEYMYVKALDTVIGAEMMEDTDIRQPETEYGKDYLLKLKDLLNEEVSKNVDTLQ